MEETSGVVKRIALGAVGGLAGTMLIQTLLIASQKWMPSTAPPMRQHPGEFMIEKAEAAVPEETRKRIPEKAETAAAQMLGIGYGMIFGALYATLRPRGGRPARDGSALGITNWAIGYMGWLPASGLMPPVWRQSFRQVVAPAVEHLLYGMATVAAYDRLRDRFG